MVKRGPQLVQLMNGYPARRSAGFSNSCRQSSQRAISGGIPVLALCPATLARMLKPPSGRSAVSGRSSTEKILESGGASRCSWSLKDASRSLVAAALMRTPALELLTVPEILRRVARLYTKGRKPTPWTMPRISSSTPLQLCFLVLEFDTSKNRGNESLRTCDVIPDNQIHMNDRKYNEPPHQQMMDKTGFLLVAED